MKEIKLTYVEPADYFPKEIREKYFKDMDDENEEEASQKKTDEDENK